MSFNTKTGPVLQFLAGAGSTIRVDRKEKRVAIGKAVTFSK
jgi:hypothetical protein